MGTPSPLIALVYCLSRGEKYVASVGPSLTKFGLCRDRLGKGKVLPYTLPSVGPGADPGVQAVSPQVTVGHPPGGRLTLLSTRPAVTSVAFTRWRQPCTVAHIQFQLTAYLSTIKDERLSWPVADGLPTTVVTRQL